MSSDDDETWDDEYTCWPGKEIKAIAFSVKDQCPVGYQHVANSTPSPYVSDMVSVWAPNAGAVAPVAGFLVVVVLRDMDAARYFVPDVLSLSALLRELEPLCRFLRLQEERFIAAVPTEDGYIAIDGSGTGHRYTRPEGGVYWSSDDEQASRERARAKREAERRTRKNPKE